MVEHYLVAIFYICGFAAFYNSMCRKEAAGEESGLSLWGLFGTILFLLFCALQSLFSHHDIGFNHWIFSLALFCGFVGEVQDVFIQEIDEG